MEHARPILTAQLLGGFAVALDGIPITAFESERGRALLAYLVVEAGRSHSREHLAGLLWPELPEERARQNLSQALYNLRNLLNDRQATQPYLLANKISIEFNLANPCRVDVWDFENLISQFKAHHNPAPSTCDVCSGWLETAVNLYKGEFLAGFSLSDSSAFDEWQHVHRERLHRQAVTAAQTLVDYLDEHGAIQDALNLAWHLAEWDPYSESAVGALMRSLAANGQYNQALARYQDYQRLLARELDIEPSQELVSLYQRLENEAAVRSGASVPQHNLPPNLTPFVGRTVEIRELSGRLRSDDCRLLSLVGPGGCGKTRLAQQTARALLLDFPDGVCFVPLGALDAAGGIAAAIGEALGVSLDSTLKPEVQVLDYLSSKRLLLILDGFERLLSSVGMLEKLLRGAPGVKIFVTTRARLNTRYETLYTLSGLGVPGEAADTSAALASEGVQLFLSGAMRAQAGFFLKDGDLGHVISICRLVEGMPLGILLAAAWAGLLSPAEIASRIRENLDFLAVDWQDLPERLRSLRATFNYSWGLLGERERQVLQSLAVFRGGFTLLAAEAVTGCSARELLRLMDKSLLQRTVTGRFEVHELVRQYAAEKLAQRMSVELAVRDRHSVHYLQVVEKAETDLKNAMQEATLRSLDLESENLRIAWRWAVDNNQTDLIQAALNGLCTYYELRWRYTDGEHACRILMESIAAEHGDEARLLLHIKATTWLYYFNCLQNLAEPAQAMWNELMVSLAGAEENGIDLRWEQALAWLGRGYVEADLFKAQDCLRQSLDLFGELGDDWRTARALTRLGMVYNRQGDFRRAIQVHDDSVTLRRGLGVPAETAQALQYLSTAYIFYGQLDEALALMEEAAALYRSMGTIFGKASAVRNLGMVYTWHGRYKEGCAMLEESIPLFQRIGLKPDEVNAHAVLGSTELYAGEYASARVNSEIACKLAEKRGMRRELAASLIVLAGLDLVESNSPGAVEHARKAVEIYGGMRYASELDWGLAMLGLAMRGAGDSQGATGALCEMLRLVERSGGGHLGLTLGLPVAALLLVDAGRLEQGMETWALACKLPAVANSPWIEQIAGRHIRAMASSLPFELQALADEHGKDGDPFQAAGWLLGLLGCQSE